MVRHVLIAILLMTGSAGAAQVRRLPPVDQCASDRSFLAFRTALNAAIARRDATFILAAASDDITSDAGYDGGRAGFARYWGLDRPERSRLWRELGAVMRLGCARDRRGQLWVPSWSLDEDAPDDASYDGQGVALPGARLLAAPNERARVLATLRWDILALPPDDDGRGAFVFVQLDARREGYVRRDQIRLLTDRTAYFERRGGRWRLVGFVLGE